MRYTKWPHYPHGHITHPSPTTTINTTITTTITTTTTTTTTTTII